MKVREVTECVGVSVISMTSASCSAVLELRVSPEHGTLGEEILEWSILGGQAGPQNIAPPADDVSKKETFRTD